MRVLLGLCLVLVLGGCNRVVTPTPLFSQADAAGAPVLRDGLWLLENKVDIQLFASNDDRCRVDTRKPVNRWPACASWVLVRGNEMLGYRGVQEASLAWESMPFVLAAGDPPVLQVGDPGDDSASISYSYFGVGQVERGNDGRATAITVWTVDCGPPPAQVKGEPTRFLTRDLLPGLIADGDNCTAESPSAVRGAATASRAWNTEPGRLRWIRDTYP